MCCCCSCRCRGRWSGGWRASRRSCHPVTEEHECPAPTPRYLMSVDMESSHIHAQRSQVRLCVLAASITDASSVLGEQSLDFSMSRLPLAASRRTGCSYRACICMMKGRTVCRTIRARCARAYVEWGTSHQLRHSRRQFQAFTTSDQAMPPDPVVAWGWLRAARYLWSVASLL